METDTYVDSEQIDYDRARDAYRVQVGENESVSVAVFELVARAVGRDSLDLPPLHGRIDTDALDSLFDVPGDGPNTSHGLVEFTYVGCRVRVFPDHEVVVEPNASQE